MSTYLEVEAKYDASNIKTEDYLSLALSLRPISHLYVEGTDVYYVKSNDEFLRHRISASNIDDKFSELTFKKKSTDSNNNIRTEVNVRVDLNKPELIEAFCEGIGYKRNFSIYKKCWIFYMPDANFVLYTVTTDGVNTRNFLEIECNEDNGLTAEESWEIVKKYEKLFSSLGISARKRLKLSLFELYRKDIK